MTRARSIAALAVLVSLFAFTGLQGGSQAAPTGRFAYKPGAGRPSLSGVADPRVLSARSTRAASGSVSRARAAAASDDIQVNGDNKRNPFSQFGSGQGFPQNETSIAINPTDRRNIIAGANDYESGGDSVSGVYASFDGGRNWPYSRHVPDVLTPDRDLLASGDPAVDFDSEGTAYFASINFARTTCDSWVTVSRSTNKGVNWTVPVLVPPDGTEYTPGDGIVAHNGGDDDCQFFHDKEYIAAGRRPAGTPLVPGSDPAHTSPDRVYVTWTLFDFDTDGTGFVEAPIYVAYSDDQGRHWSTPKEISGSAPFCTAQFGDPDANACDEDQNAHPVVNPRNGAVHVVFENFNVSSTETTQFLTVKSTDGGQTWSTPVKIADVFAGSDKYPICLGSQTLDNMCARVPLHTSNIDVNPNNGRLYVTWEDNRNGTAADTNEDVFVSRSTDGGATWSEGVNITEESTDDQFFPWISVAPGGRIAVVYFDRRYTAEGILIDTSLSVARPPLGPFATKRVSEVSWNADHAFRQGSFIGDYNGLDTTFGKAYPFWTDTRFGEANEPGNNPLNQQSDVMVDIESLSVEED